MKFLDYREKIIHGTSTFPVALYHVSPPHPRYEMSHHWHMECELIRVLSGSLLLTINNEKYTVKEGDIAYLHDGVLHGAIPSSCAYECIVFDMSYLFRNIKSCQAFIQGITNHQIVIQNFFSHAHPKIHEIVWSLFDALKVKAPGHEITATGHLHRFYGYVFEHGYYTMDTELSEKNNKRILQLKSALELIEHSYSRCLSLNDMANVAGMNDKYFCRFFQEMTGKTPIEYLNYYRIEQACFQLITTADSVTDIALNCGFNDVSYFIKTFKKFKGVTPKQYLTKELKG